MFYLLSHQRDLKNRKRKNTTPNIIHKNQKQRDNAASGEAKKEQWARTTD